MKFISGELKMQNLGLYDIWIKKIKIILPAILYCLIYSDLGAHTVILKDLKVVYGQVQRQDGENIYLKSDRGMKLIPKKNVAKIVFQDIKDDEKLKKVLKKVRKDLNPKPLAKKKPDPPSRNLADIEIESAKYILAEIEREEREELFQESMLKSLVLPGWGHIHSGREITGYFYSGIFLASLGSIAYTTWEVSRAQSAYKDTVQDVTESALLFNPNFDKNISLQHYVYANQRVGDSIASINRARNNQRTAIASTVGIYLIQLAHNYISGIRSLAEPIDSEKQDTGFHFYRYEERISSSNLTEIQTKVEYKWRL